MNKNHLETINNLILVAWEPGHLGSFFGRLLLDDILVKHNVDITSKSNLEWKWQDRSDVHLGFINSDNTHPHFYIKEFVKNNYGEADQLSAILHIIISHTLNSNKDFVSYLQSPTMDFPRTNEELKELANTKIDFSNFEFPYIKTHMNPVKQLLTLSNMPFKKKVVCKFPKNKTWLAILLVYYKHYWYYVDKDQTKLDHGVRKKIVLSFSNQQLYNYHRLDHLDDTLKDFIEVDMYDLIFNKNIEQLAKVDSRFNFGLTDTEKQLLEVVKNDTLSICKIFNVSHEWTIDVLDENLSKLIQQLEYK